ncbi:MAG: glycosyltransferase family 4 protein [Moorellales bacterium]
MLFLAVAVAFVICYFLTPLTRRLAEHWGVIDPGGGRKVHQQPVPRLGGLAIYLGFTAALLAFLRTPYTWALVAGGTAIFLVGVADDRWGLSPRVKLVGQVGAALLAYFLGVRVEFLTNPWDGLIFLGALTLPVTVFWLVAITNALNLIDGLDGLAAGVATIAATCLAAVAWLEGQFQVATVALVLAAAASAFLRYNFYPARLFMGDSGAMFLGFTLAALAVLGTAKSTTVLSLLVPVLALGLPILDTSWAVVRRLVRHRPVFAADKEHLHHRLLQMGLSQRQAVLLIYGMHTFLSLCAVLLAMLTTAQSLLMLAAVIVAALVVGNLLGFSHRGQAGAESQQRTRLRPGQPPV